MRVWLAECALRAQIEETAFGAIYPALLDGPPFPQEASSRADNDSSSDRHLPLVATTWTPSGAGDTNALREVLADAPEYLHRAKGFVTDAVRRSVLLVQLVGRRLGIKPAEHPPNEGRVALIGACSTDEIDPFLARLERCVVSDFRTY